MLLLALVVLGLGPVPAATAEPTDTPSSTASPSGVPGDEPAEHHEDLEEDEDLWLAVDTLQCAGDHRGAEVQVNSDVDGVEGDRYEWSLSRDGTVIMSDVFTYSEADDGVTGPEGFDDLAPGTYRLQVTRAGQATVVIGTDFEIVRCVGAVSGCRTLTFTNPPGNPALTIDIGGGEDDSSDDEPAHDDQTITLRPGESRAVPTLRRVPGWRAHRAYGDGESFGGEDFQQGVEQHCGDTMTRGVVGCAPNEKSNAAIDLWFTSPDDRPVRFKIIDFHELVDSGAVGADNHLQLHLPPSHYNLRVYTAAAPLPYDRVDHEVLTCMRVISTCEGIGFHNQSWSDDDVSYRVDEEATKVVRVAAQRRLDLALPAGSTVAWRAEPRHVEEPDRWVIQAGEGAAVAGRCEPGPGQLASTGAAERRLVRPTLLGLMLVLTGVILLTLDRRRA